MPRQHFQPCVGRLWLHAVVGPSQWCRATCAQPSAAQHGRCQGRPASGPPACAAQEAGSYRPAVRPERRRAMVAELVGAVPAALQVLAACLERHHGAPLRARSPGGPLRRAA